MASPKENNSWIFNSNKSHSINNSSCENFSQIISQKDPNNILALNPHEKFEILMDPTLDYISRYLLDEDAEGHIIGSYQEAALRDMEKPFYDILREKYSSSLNNQLVSKQSKVTPNFTISILKDQVGSSFSESTENLLATEFQRCVEEGIKFLPNVNRLLIDLHVSKLSMHPMEKCDSNILEFRLGGPVESGLLDRCKGKKSSKGVDLDLSEGKNCKIPMLSGEETIRDEMFDKVLLYQGENYEGEKISSLREITDLNANSLSKELNQYNNINLKSLLISCAQAVSINNNKLAGDLIKQIRKQASPTGDGVERLAHKLSMGSRHA